jgi:hypothetical protein
MRVPVRSLLLFVFIACVVQSGCGGGGGAGSSSNQNGQVLNLAGNWQANTVSSLGYDTSLSGTLTQTGSQLSGNMTIVGSPCATVGALSGTISGSSVSLSLTEGAQTVPLSGTASADGNSISGTYQAPNGGCTNGDSGTFSATRSTVTSVSVTCSPLSIQVGQTSTCSASVAGEGAFNSSVTWSTNNGSIDQSGVYTAPANADTAIVTATSSQNSSVFGTTTITINAAPAMVTSVSVSCLPSSIQVSQTSTCSAVVVGTGNFSSAVTWSVNNGSIDQNGNYSAPASAVVATVVATSDQNSAVFGSTTIAVGTAAVSWSGGPAPNIPITSQCFDGDFNGDGKADVACYTSTAGVWSVALSTGSGWQLESWSGGPGPALPVTDQCVTGDFNGDGKTDLACYTGNTGDWNVALSTGSGWQSESWDEGPLLTEEWNVVPIPGQCFAADFNGDGKTDLACSDGVDSVWSIALSTGTGWNTESWTGGPVVPLPMTQQCVSGDFNGDGTADLACWTGEGGGWAVALSTGSSWNASTWSQGPAPVDEWNVVPIPGQCFAADFNGDGKTDLACSDGVDSVWSLGLSTGSGWNTESWTGGPVVPLPMTQQCLDGDFNGDKKSDLSCWTGEGSGWAVALSTGSSWNASIWSGGPVPLDEWSVVPVPEQCFAADFSGDGITDVACYSGAGGIWNVALSSGSGW